MINNFCSLEEEKKLKNSLKNFANSLNNFYSFPLLFDAEINSIQRESCFY